MREGHTEEHKRPAQSRRQQQGLENPTSPLGGGQLAVSAALSGYLLCSQGPAKAPHPSLAGKLSLPFRLRGGTRCCWLHFRGEMAPRQETVVRQQWGTGAREVGHKDSYCLSRHVTLLPTLEPLPAISVPPRCGENAQLSCQCCRQHLLRAVVGRQLLGRPYMSEH